MRLSFLTLRVVHPAKRPLRSAHFRGRLGAALSVALFLACSGKIEDADRNGLGSGGSPTTGGTGGTDGSEMPSSGSSAGGSDMTGSGGSITIPLAGASGADEGSEGGAGPACATESAAAMLTPVYLAFAFDVSGSMGALDYPWHDPVLKWDPIVAATRDFFESRDSAGVRASLKAFPIDLDTGDRCDDDSYVDPDVSMRNLPSTAFGETLDAIRADGWRLDTPTLAVVQGLFTYIKDYRKDHDGNYAVVLVTDGMPNGCADSSIEPVEDAVRAEADEIPTYVIGVKDPPIPGAPDSVSNLQGVAEAGGTDSAFIIDTGDPEQTSADFAAVIDRIRGVSVSCNIDIPKPPNGRKFEKNKVAVAYTSGSKQTDLTYDAKCKSDDTWHYDDASAPTQVVLCDDTCSKVEQDVEAKLAVSFTCEPVISDPR